jgi:hypothetical protein
MKKQLLTASCFLLISCILHAQKDQSKCFVELSVGPSIPIGKFADKLYKHVTEDNQPAGLAKTGVSAQASFGYYLKESFGLLLASGYSVHAQDASGYEEYMKQGYISSGRMTSRVDVETQSWKIVKLMAGGFFITPLTSAENLVLLTKLTAGACKTAVPEYSYQAYDNNGMLYAGGKTNKTSLSWAFCYQVSVGFKYKLNNKLHLLIDVNSFNATPKKEYTFNPPPLPNGDLPPPRTEKVKFKLAEVNVLAGVGLSF